MKTIKFLFFALALTLGISSCSSSWLDQELNGGTLSQEEFDELDDATAMTVRGLYSLLSTNSSSDHHYFAQKSIDIATDIISGDMAMTNNAYGWFTDAGTWSSYSSGSGRNSYIWNFYYNMILNANSAIKSLSQKEDLSDEELDTYAQALTMRSYCYFNLLNLYKPSKKDDVSDGYYGKSGLDYSTVPVYLHDTETNSETGLTVEQDLSPARDIYSFIIDDLTEAIDYFEVSAQTRGSKLYVDINVARGLLAYTYLQFAQDAGDANYDSAYVTAKKVIDTGEYDIIPLDDVTSTGFVSLDNNSWMWGCDVTTENTGGLATFWGHIDIFTYSYAYSGATKGADQVLYNSIPDTDTRKEWFDASKSYIPTGKFYDLARGATADEIDRSWCNDIVFMRIEEMYLIAAEAAYYSSNYTAEANEMLATLLDQRDETVAAEVRAGSTSFSEQIYLNWRVEMWGEGKGLMTFKRLDNSTTSDGKALGSTNYNNRSYVSTQSSSTYGYDLLFQVPYAETTYNPNITELLTETE